MSSVAAVTYHSTRYQRDEEWDDSDEQIPTQGSMGFEPIRSTKKEWK